MIKTLDEAVELLMPRFNGMETYFAWPEDKFASYCHSQLSGGIGMKIRNEFGFWTKDSELYKHMVEVHGLDHPDRMSDLIIRHIYRKFNLTYPKPEKQTNMHQTVMTEPHDKKLSVKELAEAIYEGTQHVQNLAEKLARQHGKAEALTFFSMMGEDVQNFWMGIAQQLIDHASQWEKNWGSACTLSEKESERIKNLPRHPELKL